MDDIFLRFTHTHTHTHLFANSLREHMFYKHSPYYNKMSKRLFERTEK